MLKSALMVTSGCYNTCLFQAADGQHLILHPLNMKCLLHHYGLDRVKIYFPYMLRKWKNVCWFVGLRSNNVVIMWNYFIILSYKMNCQVSILVNELICTIQQGPLISLISFIYKSTVAKEDKCHTNY